jgi:hypothetical protein
MRQFRDDVILILRNVSGRFYDNNILDNYLNCKYLWTKGEKYYFPAQYFSFFQYLDTDITDWVIPRLISKQNGLISSQISYQQELLRKVGIA